MIITTLLCVSGRRRVAIAIIYYISIQLLIVYTLLGVAILLAIGVVLLLCYLIKKRSATRNGYTEINPNGPINCMCQCCVVVKRLIELDWPAVTVTSGSHTTNKYYV